MLLHLEFDHNYEIELGHWLPPKPGIEPVFYFPGASEVGGRDGLLVRVIDRRGSSWLGCFARDGSPLTRVMSCPDENRICVVSSGAGYLVQADAPREWENLPLTPIVDSRALQNQRLLIFADFTRVCAVGGQGLKWVTSHVASDGVEIAGVEGNQIRLSCWDAALGRNVPVLLDAETGELRYEI